VMSWKHSDTERASGPIMGRGQTLARLAAVAWVSLCVFVFPVAARDYPVEVVRVVDGDTVDVSVDLGLGVTKAERVRLVGVYAAELHESGGDAAREYLVLALRCPAGSVLTLRTDHDSRDKYGRLLGVFMCGAENVNERVDKNLGKQGKGVGTK